MEYNEAKGPITLFNIARQAPPFSRSFIIIVIEICKKQTIIMSPRSNFKQTMKKSKSFTTEKKFEPSPLEKFFGSFLHSKQVDFCTSLFSSPFSSLDQNKRKWFCFLKRRRYESAQEHQSSKSGPLVPPFHNRRIVPSFPFQKKLLA